MSHVLSYGGQYFRFDIGEITNAAEPDKPAFVSWSSEAFKLLEEMPRQALSRFIGGPPHPNYAEARRYTIDWIKANWDTHTKRPGKTRDLAQVIYTVWVFKRDGSIGYEFEEFADAKMFATAAEKSAESTKVVITNNESPQYLTVWERKA
jgi:hypothetical protein